MGRAPLVRTVGAAPMKRSPRKDISHKRDPPVGPAIRASKRKLSHAPSRCKPQRLIHEHQVARSCVESLACGLRQPRSSEKPGARLSLLARSSEDSRRHTILACIWRLPHMLRGIMTFLFVLSLASLAGAQGQAINGAIEGTVTDESGAVLPGVVVTVTNVDTGETRSVVTNDRGVYRAPLLPLGAYRVSAELQGFKKYDQAGISLSAGQVAVVDVKLAVGAVTETVSVTADAPVVDLGKIEEGRTLTTAEIKTLPLTSRNPYNLALLQPGVVGYETQEFGVPRLTANGALLRVNYQIDGNDNTEKDRAGLRQMPMSEVMIREVKVVTTGYAPEFGQTMGLVYIAITPSGTNRQQVQASY